MEKKECKIVQDLLMGYVEKSLTPESEKLVEDHIKSCPECQKKLAEIQDEMKGEKKQIDYLKKIRRKSRIKGILIAAGILLLLLLGIYLYRFCILNSIFSKIGKAQQTENYYAQVVDTSNSNQASITKRWYKDGKYKEEFGVYNDQGYLPYMTTYGEVGSDKRTRIYEQNKTVSYQQDNYVTTKDSIVTFGIFTGVDKIGMKLILPFVFQSVKIDTYHVGRPYYVLKLGRTEYWMSQETGFPIREITYSGNTEYYANSNIIKAIHDRQTDYYYELGKVTDQDVTIPDVSQYQVIEE